MAATRESGTHLMPIASIKLPKKARGIWLKDQATLRVQQRGFPDRHDGKEESGVPPQSLESSARSCPPINQIQACVSRT
jgi:hypothetical protein